MGHIADIFPCIRRLRKLTIERNGWKKAFELEMASHADDVKELLRDVREAKSSLGECASLLEKIQAQTEEPLAMPWPQIQRAREILERRK